MVKVDNKKCKVYHPNDEQLTGDIEQWEKERCDKEETDFLSPPGINIQNSCIARFIDRTSNAAVVQSTCGICGSLSRKFKLEGLCLQDFPNPQLLQPTKNHEAHFLKNGMLLERAGVKETDFKM